MSVIAVVGAQWGDEGKGRVVDYLADDADLVIRYGGGNNAGHTVVNPHGHFKLHLIPSGIFHPGTRNLLGNGVVINPPALVAELDGLAAAGFGADNLFISDRAHVVMPYHVLLDQLDERERGAAKIGTTSRGIGPAYIDKVARRGIRVIDLMEPDAFRERLAATLPRVRRLAAGFGDDEMADAIAEATDERRIADAYLAAAERLRPHVVDGRRSSTSRSSEGRESCSRASSAPCATSTGASIPTSPARRRSPAARASVPDCRRADRPGARRREGLHHGSRRGSASDRARRRRRCTAARARRRVRDVHRPGAPLRLVRRGRRPLQRAAAPATRASRSPSSMSSMTSSGCASGASLPRPGRRSRVDHRARVDIGLRAARARLRGACRAGAPTRPAVAHGTTCRPRPAPTSSASKSLAGRPDLARVRRARA